MELPDNLTGKTMVERVLVQTHVAAHGPHDGPTDVGLVVLAKRICPIVADGGSCWCTGACKRPITTEQTIQALEAALMEVRK